MRTALVAVACSTTLWLAVAADVEPAAPPAAAASRDTRVPARPAPARAGVAVDRLPGAAE